MVRRINVEIKIDKKFFISIGVIIILCVSCFFAGRYTRFKGVSGTGEQLVSGIVLSRDTVDTIADNLYIADAATKSADELGRAIINGIGELQRSNEITILLTDEIIGAIENNKRITEEVESAYTEISGSTEFAIDLAIKRAEEYERLIDALQQIIRDHPENLQ
jgi:hypothetical protein